MHVGTEVLQAGINVCQGAGKPTSIPSQGGDVVSLRLPVTFEMTSTQGVTAGRAHSANTASMSLIHKRVND